MNVYPFIEAEQAGKHNVKRACELLKVSRSAYYGGSAGGYAQQFNYDAWGHSTGEVLLGSAGNTGTVTNTFDLHTGRLLEQNVSATNGTTTRTVNDEAYKYDLAGNIIRQTSTRRGASTPTETQCSTYDNLARFTQAWTATDNCAATPSGQGNQTLTWDDAGRLTKIATTASTSTYVYDADGKLLIQHDPGSTTLYLEGEQLVLNTSTSVVSGTRYCILPGGIIAVRNGSSASYQFEFTDQHGTPTLYLDSTLQTPYGGRPRRMASLGALQAPGRTTMDSLTRPPARPPASPGSALANTILPSHSSSASTPSWTGPTRKRSTATPMHGTTRRRY
ncbi:hypothetical protein GCM10022255_088780 [Dactylosporangium darangshiense]|uniref:YD repeat-containing protein n=1 Tax=Dactylosporangium darangshiense TaxID=579108 RepID=A0ABP8DNG9_9ACTN